MKSFLDDIVHNILTKWIGCFIGLATAILAVVQSIVYGGISPEFYSGYVVTFSIVGALLYLILSVFKQTTSLAPTALFMFMLLALLSFVGSVFKLELLFDDLTTALFDGVSLAKIVGLEYGPAAVLMVISWLLSIVTLCVPQNSEWLYNRIKAKKANGGGNGDHVAETGVL